MAGIRRALMILRQTSWKNWMKTVMANSSRRRFLIVRGIDFPLQIRMKATVYLQKNSLHTSKPSWRTASIVQVDFAVIGVDSVPEEVFAIEAEWAVNPRLSKIAWLGGLLQRMLTKMASLPRTRCRNVGGIGFPVPMQMKAAVFLQKNLPHTPKTRWPIASIVPVDLAVIGADSAPEEVFANPTQERTRAFFDKILY